MNDVYAIITERILGLLEQGVVPWHRPWGGEAMTPRNLVSRKEYRGVNVFLLHAMGYASQFWLTYKQAQDLGGNVRRGEKSCPVVFWKWIEAEDKDSGETKRVPFLRYYSVFNASQCDGIESHVPQIDGTKREHTPIEVAERIITAMPTRPDIRYGLDKAFYSPSGDFVGMPAAGSFRSSEDFYSVLFHELTHSTGHGSRLNRKGVTGQDGDWAIFGSEPYSKEELVAEMGAAFLCGCAGIIERTVDNSAAYVQSWLQRLRDDKKLVVHAAAQAQKAADFIRGLSQAGVFAEV